MHEVREGRGSPHGGVFLDIAWIKERVPNGAEHIKKKLPSMYHQFKQLADIDITAVPMEVGPTTHYIMGGIRVDGDTPDVDGAGPVRRRRVRGGPARRQPPGRQLAVRPARVRQARRRARRQVRAASAARSTIDARQIDDGGAGGAGAVRARRPRGDAEAPYKIQYELQDVMQDNVGIVRNEAEMKKALEAIQGLKAARGEGRASSATASTTRAGTRRSTCANMLTCSEAIARARSSARRAAAATSARTSRTRTRRSSKFNLVVRKGAGRPARAARASRSPPMRDDLKQVIEENK